MKFGKARKIFIVEDDSLQSTLLKDRLTRDVPHQISVFSTGEECLRHLHENPEVVILDYNLDKDNKDAANGVTILGVIKKSNPDTHVIMLSSQERYSIALQSIQKGAEQYVIKDGDAFEKVNNLVNALI